MQLSIGAYRRSEVEQCKQRRSRRYLSGNDSGGARAHSHCAVFAYAYLLLVERADHRAASAEQWRNTAHRHKFNCPVVSARVFQLQLATRPRFGTKNEHDTLLRPIDYAARTCARF